MSERTLHLMTQRGQPYGSERKCCEMCGLMLVYRDNAFWEKHVWTSEPEQYHPHAEADGYGPLTPCTPRTPT